MIKVWCKVLKEKGRDDLVSFIYYVLIGDTYYRTTFYNYCKKSWIHKRFNVKKFFDYPRFTSFSKREENFPDLVLLRVHTFEYPRKELKKRIQSTLPKTSEGIFYDLRKEMVGRL